jgi:hypothetical protein
MDNTQRYKDQAKVTLNKYIHKKWVVDKESTEMVLGRLLTITSTLIQEMPGAAEWIESRYKSLIS